MFSLVRQVLGYPQAYWHRTTAAVHHGHMPQQLQVSALRRTLQVCTRADLIAAGYSPRTIKRAFDAGQLTKLGRFWLGTGATPRTVAAALRRNHRLTCVSALALHGVFVPETPGVHEVGRQCRCVSPEGVIEHRGLRAWPDTEPILPVRWALGDAARCLDADGAAMVLESALNKRLVDDTDVTLILTALPQRKQLAIGTPDERAMSGPETRVRRFLERRGVAVVPQFPLPDGGFADMLVGEQLLIECDSRAHHTDPRAFAADRRRDQRNVLRGYTVVRLTYQDVMDNWSTTQQLLIALIRRGAHRRTRYQR